MKKQQYITRLLAVVCMACAFSGCYDDKGGNDFDTPIEGVEIIMPATAFSAGLGETLTIAPTIKTSIPDTDLEFYWEALGAYVNEQGAKQFYTFAEGRSLDYACTTNEAMTDLNTSYTCRVRAHQKSTGRDFYSADPFTITIQGVTGLMILHDDGQQSDISVLMAGEFMPASSTIPEKAEVRPNFFSQQNNGKTVSGQGVQVIQSVVSTGGSGALNSKQIERCRILVRTDRDASWANMADFSYYGDWSSMFFLKGDKKVNAGQPKGYDVASIYAFASDGDDLFIMSQSYQYPFLFASYTPTIAAGDGNCFTMAPQLALKIRGYSADITAYANDVNGTGRKGFVSILSATRTTTTSLLDTKNDIVPFNPGDMKADLITMQYDNRYHVLAVLRGHSDHPSCAGKLFTVDLFPRATADGQESGKGGVPQHLYDLSAQPDVEQARWFDFGDTQNMAYYATATTLYHYGFDGANLVSAQPLTMTDGSQIGLSGEITMMKLLRHINFTTHSEDPMLVVATHDGSKSTLHALTLDTMTGNVVRANRYDSSTVAGWPAGIIRDVNIKGM